MDKFDEKIENIRQVYLMIGEAMDAIRLAPRTVLISYMWFLNKTINWFMSIEPVMSKDGMKVLIDGPTTQETAMLTAVIGMGAAIYAFYSSSGRNWEHGIVSWKHMIDPTKQRRRKTDDKVELTDVQH